MTVSQGLLVATTDGILLFGRTPKRFLPQSGIRAVCFPGTEPDYATRADENLRGPMVSLRAANGDIIEAGLVEQAWDFVRRNTTPIANIEDTQRVDSWQYPESVVREAVVNALVHRDYSIAGTDIMLEIYSNRLEITSPGRLPNTITPDGMKAGARYARNQTLVNIMRDYGYAEARGMGVRNKIIPGMFANITALSPDLIEDDKSFYRAVVEVSPRHIILSESKHHAEIVRLRFLFFPEYPTLRGKSLPWHRRNPKSTPSSGNAAMGCVAAWTPPSTRTTS